MLDQLTFRSSLGRRASFIVLVEFLKILPLSLIGPVKVFGGPGGGIPDGEKARSILLGGIWRRRRAMVG